MSPTATTSSATHPTGRSSGRLERGTLTPYVFEGATDSFHELFEFFQDNHVLKLYEMRGPPPTRRLPAHRTSRSNLRSRGSLLPRGAEVP